MSDLTAARGFRQTARRERLVGRLESWRNKHCVYPRPLAGAIRAVETPRGFRAKAHLSRSLALGTTDQDGEHKRRVSPGARDARRACGEMKWRGPPRRADTVSEVINTFGVSWRIRRSRKMARATRQRRSSSAVLAVLLETPSPRPPRVIVLAPAPARGAARTRASPFARVGRARFVPRSRSAFSFAPRASVWVSFPTPSPRSADEDAAPSGVSGLHPGVTAWTRDAILSLPRDEQRALTALVDEAGVRSARAQQLPNAITSVVRRARAEQASVRPPRSRRAVPHPDPLSSARLHPLHPTTAPHPSPSSPGPIAGPPDARTAPVPLLRRLHVSPRRSLRLARHPQSWL